MFPLMPTIDHKINELYMSWQEFPILLVWENYLGVIIYQKSINNDNNYSRGWKNIRTTYYLLG